MPFDGKLLGEQIVSQVKDFVGRALGAVTERVEALEKRTPIFGPQGNPGRDGVDGKDAPPVDTAALAREVLSLVTKPRDGVDGAVGPVGKSAYQFAVERGFSGTELQWLDSIKGAPGPIGERGETGPAGPQGAAGATGERGLPGESVKGEQGEQGVPGRDGKDADPAVVKALVDEAVSALPIPKDGRDADPEEIAASVERGIALALPGAVQKAIDALMPGLIEKAAVAVPRPRDGVDGAKGEPGRDAPEVDVEALALKVRGMIPVPRDGLDGKDADPVDFDALVAKAVALIPRSRDGVDGKDATVDAEEIAASVLACLPEIKDGRDGVDGKSVTLEDIKPLVEAELARWEVDFERHATEVLRKMPPPKDGKDGFSLDDLEFTLEGRTFTFALHSGDRVVTKQIKVPFPIDKGVYRSGTAYEQGDTVTFGGSQWIALKDTKSKPPSDDWRLQVRRGSDGKDAA